MRKRVVVTGVGMVTPLGAGKDTFHRKLIGGNSGISPITAFNTSRFSAKLGAEVSDFNPKEFVSLKNLRKMDRLSRMTAASARMALEDAGVSVDTANRDRVGIVLGVAYGSTDVAAQFASVLFSDGPMMVNPILVPNTVMNAPAGHTSIELGFRGINSTVNHHEASAETAIAYAAAELKRGRADVVLAGGADIISEFFFEILTHFRALSPVNGGPEQARPFDCLRNGPVAGEGAGILCLETLQHARARGASVYCEIAGWGLSAASSPLNDWPSDPKGPILAISRALESAQITPGQIDYISASANGGRKLDRLEAEALSAVFGKEKQRPFISSIKGAVGESFSSGGIRAAAMAMSIKEKVMPPTLGLKNPVVPLRYILNEKKEAPIKCGLVNGFSSGGTFAAIAMRKIT
jgi:3-oxoacyl-[acyl-carrier-protein] synthase II